MKFGVLLVFFFFQSAIFGQVNSFGLINGVSFSTVSSRNFLNDISFKYGYSGGFEFVHSFENRVHLKTGLIYSQKGFRTVFYTTDNWGNPVNFGAKSSYNYNYVSIPLSIGYQYGSSFFGEIDVGISFEGLVNSNSRLLIGNDEILSKSTKEVNPFDICPNISLGQGYCFKNELSIILFTEFSHGILQLNNVDYFSGSHILNKNFFLRFTLRKSFNMKTTKEQSND